MERLKDKDEKRRGEMHQLQLQHHYCRERTVRKVTGRRVVASSYAGTCSLQVGYCTKVLWREICAWTGRRNNDGRF
jgi:hypothetical protein